MKIVESLNKLGEILVIKKWKPIGTILMFDREQDMSKLYYGTWQLTLTERSPIGVNPSSSENRFKTAGQQFGEKTHTLTINEIPPHSHTIPFQTNAGGGQTNWGITAEESMTGGVAAVKNGGGQAHNNIHPVETVYFYKRIA